MSVDLTEPPTMLAVDSDALDKFRCGVCMLIKLKNMSYCVNGHTFCEECCTKIPNCAQCRGPPAKFDGKFADALHLNSLLKQLVVKCSNHILGCKYAGCVVAAQAHVQEDCPFTLVRCPASCGEMVMRGDVGKHLLKDHGGLAVNMAIDHSHQLQQMSAQISKIEEHLRKSTPAFEKMDSFADLLSELQRVPRDTSSIMTNVNRMSSEHGKTEAACRLMNDEVKSLSTKVHQQALEMKAMQKEVAYNSSALVHIASIAEQKVNDAVAAMPKKRARAETESAKQARLARMQEAASEAVTVRRAEWNDASDEWNDAFDESELPQNMFQHPQDVPQHPSTGRRRVDDTSDGEF